MGGGWVMEFKKVFVKCLALNCKRRHYARGYCEMHYHRFYRRKYCQSWDEHLNFRISQRLKEPTKNKVEERIEIPIKNKTAKELYQRIKEANINTFRYKDIENLIEWKYEKIKKYILFLVKLDKIIPIEEHSGGKQAVFKISA